MNVLSLFDGISCGRVALERAGIKVTNYFSSEIKPHAIKVANYNYPQDAKNRLGDITKIKGDELPCIDLLIGGSPCQDFSLANKNRVGIHGEKSKLFFEFLRIKKETNPKYWLLENVKMKKEFENIISKFLGVEPIKINSEKVSPQLRARLYWTNIPNIKPIEDLGLHLNDFINDGYTERKKARTLLTSDSRCLITPIKMCHRFLNSGFTTLIFKDKNHFEQIKNHFDKYFKGKTAKEIDVLSKQVDLSIYEGVRYMSSREKESCQTLPLGYTDILTQNKAADVLGDGWTINVISHIFKHLNK